MGTLAYEDTHMKHTHTHTPQPGPVPERGLIQRQQCGVALETKSTYWSFHHLQISHYFCQKPIPEMVHRLLLFYNYIYISHFELNETSKLIWLSLKGYYLHEGK